MKDLALILVSISLWLIAVWLSVTGYFRDDLWLFLAGPAVAAVAWWAWPSGALPGKNRRSPWSY